MSRSIDGDSKRAGGTVAHHCLTTAVVAESLDGIGPDYRVPWGGGSLGCHDKAARAACRGPFLAATGRGLRDRMGDDARGDMSMNQCGAQLRAVLGALGTRLTAAMPGLLLDREKIAANDGQIDPAQDFAGHADDVRMALTELAALSSAAEAGSIH